MNDRFMTEREVMAVLGIRSRSTLWRWEKDGEFPRRYRLGKSCVRYRESEIEEWVLRREPVPREADDERLDTGRAQGDLCLDGHTNEDDTETTGTGPEAS